VNNVAEKDECCKIRRFSGEQTYSFLCWHIRAAKSILLNLKCLNRFNVCAWFSFNHCSFLLCKHIRLQGAGPQLADIFGWVKIIVADVVPNNYTCFWEAIAWLRPWQWLIFLHVSEVLSLNFFVKCSICKTMFICALIKIIYLQSTHSWYIFDVHPFQKWFRSKYY